MRIILNQNYVCLSMLMSMLILSSAIGVASAFCLAISLSSDNVLLIYLNLLSVYIFIFIGFFMLIAHRFNVTDLRSGTTIGIMAACAYFVLWMFLGLLFGQNMRDAIGSTARALIPFLVFFIIYFVLNRSDDRILFVRGAAWIIIATISVGALGKLYLISQGKYYGAGLNQFSMGSFLFVLLAIFILFGKHSRYKLLLLLYFISLVTLSVLSFKRGVWLVIFLSTIYVSWICWRIDKKKVVLPIILLLFLLLPLINFTEIGVALVRRAFSTVSLENFTFDLSTGYRIAEISGALSKLNENIFSYIFGYGPGAVYEDVSKFGLSVTNDSTAVFHIHSGIFLVLYRYGIVGLFLYFIPLVFLLMNSRKVLNRMRHQRPTKFFDDRVLVMAFTCSALVMWPLGIVSNSFFGSAEYGLSLVSAYILLRFSDALPGKSR